MLMNLILSTHNVTLTKAIEEHIISRITKLEHLDLFAINARVTLEHDQTKAPERQFSCYMRLSLPGPDLFAEDLEEDLGRESDLLTFLSLRFRPAVQVTDEDIQKYYENVLKGAGKPLNEMRAEIEQKLTIERADKELDLWLKDQRKRTKIQYLEKGLEDGKADKK